MSWMVVIVAIAESDPTRMAESVERIYMSEKASMSMDMASVSVKQ